MVSVTVIGPASTLAGVFRLTGGFFPFEDGSVGRPDGSCAKTVAAGVAISNKETVVKCTSTLRNDLT
jgi:hypothetical protein